MDPCKLIDKVDSEEFPSVLFGMIDLKTATERLENAQMAVADAAREVSDTAYYRHEQRTSGVIETDTIEVESV